MRSLRRASNPWRSALLLTGLIWCGAGSATAQTGMTTLGALSDRADAIVVVRALRNRADDGTREVRFRVLRSLSGHAPSSFTLSEPEARACGRALHGVLPGTAHLAFLRTRAHGEPVLVSTGSRALPRLVPGLEDHVKSLVETREEGPARAVLLADSLLSGRSSRIVNDAAFDLRVHPHAARIDTDRRIQLRGLCMDDENDPVLRFTLAQILARFDGPSDHEVLRDLAGKQDPWLRFAGRLALERARSTAALRATIEPPAERPVFRSIRPRRRR